MAIEYVAGVDLARVEDRARALSSAVPIPVALLIGQQMCEALGYAHRKVGGDGVPLGIVHRDVSPQNVMVSYEGEVKVIDFGLAKSSARSKHTLPSTVLGKLGYMSPEQARADKVDHRSDIYSAGIVIWELLAGRAFINGGTVGEMVAQMASPKIPPLREIRPEVSEAVERIVVRALQPDPSARYNRADDFARAINEQLVRENMSVGSEDVGDYVRAMCPEEFAAERKLQSRLSDLRKRGGSNPSLLPQPSVRKSGPVDGTLVRAPASGAAVGVVQPAAQTPRPNAVPSAPPTAAQRAMSTVWRDDGAPADDTLPPQSGHGLRPQSGGAASVPNVIIAPQSTPALSGEYQVPKSKAPMIIVLLFGLVAVAGGGYFAWEQFGRDGGGSSEPLVIEPPPPTKKDEPEVAAADGREPAKVEAAGAAPATEPSEPKSPVAPVKLERIEVKGAVWKIIRDGDKHYVQATGKPRLVVGDEVKVLGPEVAKSQREVYGIAAVVEVKGSLARLLIDEDTQMPPKAFAVKELGPKRAARIEAKRQVDAARGAAPATGEPAKAEPQKAEPQKTEPQKTDVAAAKTEPSPAEPKKDEHVAVTDAPGKQETPVKIDKPERAPVPSSYKTLTGGIVLGRGGRKVHVFNRNDFNWHGCEIWTPTKKHFKYEPEAEIAAGDSDGVDYGRFEDFTKPEDPQFANGWALVRCKEGAGYVQFKAN